MPMRSRWGFRMAALAMLVAGVLVGRVAFSGKAPEQPALPPAPPTATLIENKATLELTHKLLNDALGARTWTMKDHERIAPLFYSLRTEQKIEILKKVGAALDAKQLKVERGARLF